MVSGHIAFYRASLADIHIAGGIDITNELTIDADGRSTLDITGNGVARTDDGLELAHVLGFLRAVVIQQVDLRKIIFAFAKKHHLSLPPLFVPCAGKTAQLL